MSFFYRWLKTIGVIIAPHPYPAVPVASGQVTIFAEIQTVYRSIACHRQCCCLFKLAGRPDIYRRHHSSGRQVTPAATEGHGFGGTMSGWPCLEPFTGWHFPDHNRIRRHNRCQPAIIRRKTQAIDIGNFCRLWPWLPATTSSANWSVPEFLPHFWRQSPEICCRC